MSKKKKRSADTQAFVDTHMAAIKAEPETEVPQEELEEDTEEEPEGDQSEAGSDTNSGESSEAGDAGEDTLGGESGADSIAGEDSNAGGEGEDTLSGSEGGDTITSAETETSANDTDDPIAGDEGDDDIPDLSIFDDENAGDFLVDLEEEHLEQIITEEQAAEIAGDIIASVKPSIFLVYAKQVLKYNGNDEKEAWFLFCMSFSEMMRFKDMHPSEEFLTQEQRALVMNAIDMSAF